MDARTASSAGPRLSLEVKKAAQEGSRRHANGDPRCRPLGPLLCRSVPSSKLVWGDEGLTCCWKVQTPVSSPNHSSFNATTILHHPPSASLRDFLSLVHPPPPSLLTLSSHRSTLNRRQHPQRRRPVGSLCSLRGLTQR